MNRTPGPSAAPKVSNECTFIASASNGPTDRGNVQSHRQTASPLRAKVKKPRFAVAQNLQDLMSNQRP